MITTQGELKERVDSLVVHRLYNENALDDDTCLCPIDVEATLDKAGVSYTYHRGWDEYRIPPGQEHDRGEEG